MKRFAWLLVAALLCLFAPPALASVQIAILFDELVQTSTSVAVVTGLEQKSVWEEGRIYTYTRVKCDRALAGELKQGGEAWIRTMGGVVGDVGQSVSGEAAIGVGAPSIVFVHAGPAGSLEVTARAQGQYPVIKDAARNERTARAPDLGALLPAPQARVDRVRAIARAPMTTSATQAAVEVASGRTVDELARDVGLAWQRTHAR
jgi:hypothetical protein